MRKAETRRQRRIQRELKALYASCWFFKVHGSEYQPSGIPDLVGCIDGIFCAFEVKEPDGVVSLIQEFQINGIREAGGCAGVIETIEDAVGLIDAFRQTRSIPKKRC